MSEIHFSHLEMLHLLWILPVLLCFYIYASMKRKQAVSRFVDAGILPKLDISLRSSMRLCKMILVLLSIVAIVMALVRPGWNPKAKTLERMGRDVVFLLDVSRSMMAEDLKPNRLEMAKISIMDCIDQLQGDRVALVAFAGTSVVKCPLTLDYGFFRAMLQAISQQSIERGGTMIGDAIRKILQEVFDEQDKQYKDIVLITDGEDHDSFPVQAAEEAGKRGIRIIAIGLGDEEQGTRIPVVESGRKTFLQYRGQEVWSKLDAITLRKMVNATPDGKYFNVATGAIDLGSIYKKLIAEAEKRKLESKTIKRYEEKFQIFLAIALLLLYIESILSEKKQRG